LSSRQTYKYQLKLEKEGKAKSLEQSCEDMRKSENNMIIERTNLTKIEKKNKEERNGKKRK